MLMKIDKINANVKDNGEGTHQTGHCYIFLIERELESCWMLILRAGRPSFTHVYPLGRILVARMLLIIFWQFHEKKTFSFMFVRRLIISRTSSANN